MELEWTADTVRGGQQRGVRVRTPAKINLYLEIIGERPDGFHDIDSLFQAVSLYDTIDFATELSSASDRLEVTGAPGRQEAALPQPEGNLVLRAAALVRKAAKRHGRGDRTTGRLRIRLEKAIPMGAGLGGGSSDAAATLLALNRLWNLELSQSALSALACQLGSDVPFFLYGGLAHCSGRGEKVRPLPDSPTEPLHFVLVSPSIEVPTPQIYQEYRRQRQRGLALTTLKPLTTIPPSSFSDGIKRGGLLQNRLQPVAFCLFPALRLLYEALTAEPFVKVLMTGSGSTFFGVCRGQEDADDLSERLEARVLGPRPLGELSAFGQRGAFGPTTIKKVHGLPGWSAQGL